MLNLGPATKVHLLAGATDMRLGFEGLMALAAGPLIADPLSGHLFVFCNKGRSRLKVLYWDGSGLWVCAKRLEKGRFAWPQPVTTLDGVTPLRNVTMAAAEFTMLIAGVDLDQTKRRAWYRVGAG